MSSDGISRSQAEIVPLRRHSLRRPAALTTFAPPPTCWKQAIKGWWLRGVDVSGCSHRPCPSHVTFTASQGRPPTARLIAGGYMQGRFDEPLADSCQSRQAV
jgi:hypothetical protein